MASKALCHTHRAFPYSVIWEAFLESERNKCKDPQPDMWRYIIIGMSLFNRPPELMKSWEREGRKRYKSHNGWRTQGKQDPLNQQSQYIRTHRDESSRHGVYMCLHQVLLNGTFSLIYLWNSWLWERGGLWLLSLLLGLLSFSLIALSDIDMIIFALFYCILFWHV